ncbi:MAG TPA: tandem-95 repeat protein [Vicinamibacterales bacterium]|nr:tandem-95 repeat protein [Vicinamibacterales bacterium]
MSSGCTDETLPSVYYAYNAASQVLFFRWRVQSPPHNYATGPSAGAYSSTGPWNSALYSVFMDINGDGYRDFAVHLDGSSGGPATAIDRLAAIYSTSKSQSLDYVNDTSIKLLSHNPTAFVDGPSLSERILSFQNSLTPTSNWPNGASETGWDYGSTRATLLNTGCGEYFIDYQIPLAMLNATAHGGPQVTATTPMSLFFATANSLNNPLQKDAVVAGDFIADPLLQVPGGDIITPAGGTILQPTVSSIGAAGCGPTALTATVFDTLNNDRTTSVTGVTFFSYLDVNGNGVADDAGSSWTTAVAGATANNPVGAWTGSWNASALIRGQYLIGLRATDAQGNVTWSHLTQTQVNADQGATPPNYPNATGVVTTTVNNTCGAAGPSVSKSVSPSAIAAGQNVTFTITVANTLASALTVSNITDALPSGFTYQSTSGAGTLDSATTSPSAGAGGTVAWTFSPAVSVPASSSRTLVFVAQASSVGGTYTNAVTATTSYGTLTSAPIQIGVGSPQLTISKAASVASANPGDTVTYTISYANDSPVNVTNAVITDVLPTGLDFVSASGGGTYNAGTRTVTWSVGALQSNSGPASVTLTTSVTSPYPGSATTPVINTAAIASTETSATSTSAAVYVSALRAQLSVQKEGSVSQVTKGDTAASNVTYTLTYANTGQASAAAVTITDVIPTGLTFISATGGGTNASGTVTWNIGVVAAGGAGSVQLVLRVPSGYTGASSITNTATISATGLSATADSYRINVTDTAQVCSDYYFTKTTASVGSAGTQRLANTTVVTAADTGTSVSGQWISGNGQIELARFYQDPAVSSEVSFSGATVTSSIWIDRANGAAIAVTGELWDYNPSNGTQTAIGTTTQSFGGSTKGEFQFSVTPSNRLEAGHRLLWIYKFANNQNTNTVVLHVQFGGTSTNPISGGTTAALAKSRVCTTAPASPVIGKQVDKLVAAPGETLTYTVRFGNAGQTNMTSTQIVDTLPAGVTFTGATLNGAAVTPTIIGQQLTFAVRSSDTATAGQVTGGQSGVLVITAAVSLPFGGASNTLTNSVSFASTQTIASTDSITTTLLRPSVTISKSADDTSLVPGNIVTYTLDVLNAGPGAATDVTVTDALPVNAYFTYVAGSARLNGAVISPDPVSAGTLTKNIGALAAGAAGRVTFQMLVANAGAPAGVTTLANTATVSDAQSSGTRGSNSVSVSISTNPSLTVTKSTSPAGPVAPGSVVVYTVTVTNSGSGTASSVLVSSPLPSNSSYVSGTLVYESGVRTDVADGDNGYFDTAGNRAVFDVGSLASGGSRSMTYSVRVASPLSNGTTTLSSTATITASNASTRQVTASINASAAPVLTLSKSAPAAVAFPLTTLAADATNTTTITVASAASLSIGAVVSVGGTASTITAITGSTVVLGTAVTGATGAQVLPTWQYVLGYANTGTASATGVVIQDTLPGGLTFISADTGGTNTGGTVTWNLGTVAAGASGTVGVRVRPGSAGGYSNTATLVSAELSTVTSNTTTTAVGSLTVDKSTTTANGSTSGTATTATYVVTLRNQSPTTAADNVTIADILAPGFVYQSTTSLAGATAATSPVVGDTQPTWTGLSIPASGTATLTFVARINNVGAGTYQNEVTVTSTTLNVHAFDALATTAEDVTLAAARGTTGVITITSTTPPGGTLTITVSDADLNTSTASQQTVQVAAANARTNESDTVTLTETGVSTGVFSGTLATQASSSAGTSNAAPLNVQNGDTVNASYVDALTASGTGATVTASSSVVSAGNTAPVAVANSYTVAEDATLTVAAAGVLTNDTDADANALTAVLVGTVSNGTLTLNANGSFTYVPTANYNGSDSFTYKANDGTADSNTVTVSLTITAVNDAPVAVANSYTVAEDTTLTVVAAGVLTNDTDADGNALTAVLGSTVSNGTLTLNADGSFTYVPTANYNGSDSFTYKANDGTADSNTVVVSLTITAVNDAPVVAMTAATLGYTTGDGATVMDGGLTVADVDSVNLTGATVSISAGFVAAQDALAFTTQNGITGTFDSATGVLTLTGTATVAHYQAALRSVTYRNTSSNPSTLPRTISVTVSDGALSSTVATRTITIAAVNNQPTLDQPAAVTIDEDSGALTMTLTGIGAGGGESQPLTISAASGDASLFAHPTVTYTSPNGTGSITFTPSANAFGSTSLTVTVSDGSSAITRTVVVTVLPVNDAPTLDPVANRSGVVGVSVSVPLAGLSSGAANESQTLVLSAVSSNPAVLPHPTVAYVSPNGTGALSLTPQALGTAQVTVTVHDGATANATTTRTFTVTIGHNTPPTITSIANMIVVEGKAFPSAAFTVGDAETPASGLTVTVSSSNTALVGATGLAPSGSFSGRALTVTPVHGRIGDSDVTITVSDGELTASTTFRATVRPRWDYYLLEGQTDGGVATDIRITNPHSVVAPIRLTFVRADGTTADRSYDVPPSTRQSIRINAFPEAGAGGVSTFIKSINDLPLLIERTRVLDGTGFAGDSETALESTNASWYFADGLETDTHHSNLVLANPNFEVAQIQVTFLLDRGAPVRRTYPLQPVSRLAIPMATVAELRGRTFGIIVTSDLPMVAERSVTFDGPRVTESTAVATGQPYPSTSWYFAEGSAWKVFNTFVLVANPNPEDAVVTIAYYTTTGGQFETRHTVAAFSRITVDALASEPRLEGEHFWMRLRATRPVIAERAMYWDRRAPTFVESHMSGPVLEPGVKWWTGDARVGGPEKFDTYLMIGNPSSSTAQLRITYYPDNGTPIVTARTLGPNGRATVHVNLAVPEIRDDSFWAIIESTNDVPIIIERSIYWNADANGGWAAGTNVAALPVVPATYGGC